MLQQVKEVMIAQQMHHYLHEAMRWLWHIPQTYKAARSIQQCHHEAIDAYMHAIEQQYTPTQRPEARAGMLRSLYRGIRAGKAIDTVVPHNKWVRWQWSTTGYSRRLQTYLLTTIRTVQDGVAQIQHSAKAEQDPTQQEIYRTTHQQLEKVRDTVLTSVDGMLHGLMERIDGQQKLNALYRKIHKDYMHQRDITTSLQEVKKIHTHIQHLDKANQADRHVMMQIPDELQALADHIATTTQAEMEKVYTTYQQTQQEQQEKIDDQYQQVHHTATVHVALWKKIVEDLQAYSGKLQQQDMHSHMEDLSRWFARIKEQHMIYLSEIYTKFHHTMPLFHYMQTVHSVYDLLLKQTTSQLQGMHMYVQLVKRFVKRYLRLLEENKKEIGRVRYAGVPKTINWERAWDREITRVTALVDDITNMTKRLKQRIADGRQYIRASTVYRRYLQQLLDTTSWYYLHQILQHHIARATASLQLIKKDATSTKTIAEIIEKHRKLLEIHHADVKQSLSIAPSDHLRTQVEQIEEQKELIDQCADMIHLHKKHGQSMKDDLIDTREHHQEQRKIIQKHLQEDKQQEKDLRQQCKAQKIPWHIGLRYTSKDFFSS